MSTCEHCQVRRTPARLDARFCSGRCRAAAYRERQAAEHAATVAALRAQIARFEARS